MAVLIGLLAWLFISWGGFSIWYNMTRYDPVRLIRRGNVDERQRAARDLRVVSEHTDFGAVIAALVRALEDTDAAVRAAAAESLGVVVTAVALRTDRTPKNQELTNRQVDLAIRALSKRLSDPDPMVRASVVRSLGSVGENIKVNPPPELFAGLTDESRSVRQATYDALDTLPLTSAAIPSSIQALLSRDREIRFHAAEILGRLGPDAGAAVPTLLAILKEPFDLQERTKNRVVAWYWDPACSAAKALGQIAANDEVIAILAEMLSSDVAERVSAAADGLGKMGPRAVAAVPQLIAAFDRAQQPGQHMIGQITISRSLGLIAPKTASAPDAIAILTKALDSGDVWVRLGSAQALGSFGADAAGAIPKLRALTQDSRQDVRDAARAALSTIETPSGPIRASRR
jgi:HEAT repeat protein